jgi:PadR family transcriptional regulator, regulatory protein AphA
MELDLALLGLIRLHQGVTGYELNRIIRESTGYLMSASLSHIYPALKRLHDRGLVSYIDTPLKNRPSKKVYMITAAGDTELQAWLEVPVESSLDFKPFCLKMAFSPLMRKETILQHIDREIACRESLRQQREPGIQVEVDYLDKEQFNRPRAELLWDGLYQVQSQTETLRVAWLKDWRKQLEHELKD